MKLKMNIFRNKNITSYLLKVVIFAHRKARGWQDNWITDLTQYTPTNHRPKEEDDDYDLGYSFPGICILRYKIRKSSAFR